MVDSLAACLIASEDWSELERRFCEEITHVASNTGEAGFMVGREDSSSHEEKMRRRWLPVHEMARSQGHLTPRLTALLDAMAIT